MTGYPEVIGQFPLCRQSTQNAEKAPYCGSMSDSTCRKGHTSVVERFRLCKVWTEACVYHAIVKRIALQILPNPGCSSG